MIKLLDISTRIITIAVLALAIYTLTNRDDGVREELDEAAIWRVDI